MINDIFLGCLDQIATAPCASSTPDFTMTELLAVVEKAKEIPQPEHDCIVMTD